MTRRADHRPSTCHRHPTAAPSAGFCPSCLCERLASVDPSSTDKQLQRSRSDSSAAAAAAGRDGVNCNANEPRRKSCDSRGREQEGLAKEVQPDLGEIRICERLDGEFAASSGEFEGEGEMRTMRELIDLEQQSKKPTRKESRSLWYIGEKLRKWRRKGIKRIAQGHVEVAGVSGLRQRSCHVDTAIAARVSVDYPRNSVSSFDEPRASLDGYLLSRTYRLTPLVSVIKDTKIIHSGLDCCENPNAYLDRSNSRKKGAALEVGELKPRSAVNPRVSLDGSESELFYRKKLVITERELMEWYSNSKKAEEDGSGVVSVKTRLKPALADIHSSIPVPCTVDCEQLEKSKRWWSIRGLTR